MSDDLFNALDGAVIAAEAACQTSAAIWGLLTTEQQDHWLSSRSGAFPPLTVYLKTIVPAAHKMIADDNALGPR